MYSKKCNSFPGFRTDCLRWPARRTLKCSSVRGSSKTLCFSGNPSSDPFRDLPTETEFFLKGHDLSCLTSRQFRISRLLPLQNHSAALARVLSCPLFSCEMKPISSCLFHGCFTVSLTPRLYVETFHCLRCCTGVRAFLRYFVDNNHKTEIYLAGDGTLISPRRIPRSRGGKKTRSVRACASHDSSWRAVTDRNRCRSAADVIRTYRPRESQEELVVIPQTEFRQARGSPEHI